jgi:hypothetical protein
MDREFAPAQIGRHGAGGRASPWQYAWCATCNGLLGRDSLSEEWHHRGEDCGNTVPERLDTDKTSLSLEVKP